MELPCVPGVVPGAPCQQNPSVPGVLPGATCELNPCVPGVLPGATCELNPCVPGGHPKQGLSNALSWICPKKQAVIHGSLSWISQIYLSGANCRRSAYPAVYPWLGVLLIPCELSQN